MKSLKKEKRFMRFRWIVIFQMNFVFVKQKQPETYKRHYNNHKVMFVVVVGV